MSRAGEIMAAGEVVVDVAQGKIDWAHEELRNWDEADLRLLREACGNVMQLVSDVLAERIAP